MNASKTNTHLRDVIHDIRASLGDGLNDAELTRLLRQTVLPTEARFVFLGISHGFVTLTVPQQDLANCYPEQGWIVADKERIGRDIGKKYGLSLGEPPDHSPGFLFPPSDSPIIHHRLELTNRWETVVVAHPHYLKIRLFGARPAGRYVSNAQAELSFGPELLQDLSALYQP